MTSNDRFELRQYSAGLVIGTPIGSTEAYTLLGRVDPADGSVTLTQSYSDGKQTEWHARVGQMGEWVMMTAGSWRGSFEGNFTARRVSPECTPTPDLGPMPPMRGEGLAVTLLQAEDAQGRAVTEWSGVTCELRLEAKELEQLPMRRRATVPAERPVLGGVSAILADSFEMANRQGPFTPATLALALAPDGEDESGGGGLLAGHAVLSLKDTTAPDLTVWLALGDSETGAVTGRVLARVRWQAGLSPAPCSAALISVAGESPSTVVLKERTNNAETNRIVVEERTVSTLDVRAGQHIEWDLSVTAQILRGNLLQPTTSDAPPPQRSSSRLFSCFSAGAAAASAEDETQPSLDVALWFCPTEGTPTPVALDGAEAGVARVCAHTGCFDAPAEGQLVFVLGDEFKFESEEVVLPTAEEGVPPVPPPPPSDSGSESAEDGEESAAAVKRSRSTPPHANRPAETPPMVERESVGASAADEMAAAAALFQEPELEPEPKPEQVRSLLPTTFPSTGI